MKVRFEVGSVAVETEDCARAVALYGQEMAAVLKDMQYPGTVGRRNSFQLDIAFDEALLARLDQRLWKVQWRPSVDMAVLGENWGRQQADAIVEFEDLGAAALEIEKANKKTIWFDFMKLWMFVESEQASCGLIVCPTNYAHRHGVWNLYEEARGQKRFLRRFAQVPRDRLSLIGIVGYEQRLLRNGASVVWDSTEFNRVKADAGRQG